MSKKKNAQTPQYDIQAHVAAANLINVNCQLKNVQNTSQKFTKIGRPIYIT